MFEIYPNIGLLHSSIPTSLKHNVFLHYQDQQFYFVWRNPNY